jgi:hypothetical protein
MNGWDVSSIRLHVLQLGLKYQQIDMILPALESLEPAHYAAACSYLLSFFQSHRPQQNDPSLSHRLFQIALLFLARVIKEVAESSPPPEVVHPVQQETSTVRAALRSILNLLVTLPLGGVRPVLLLARDERDTTGVPALQERRARSE